MGQLLQTDRRYLLTGKLFLRLLALVYLAAFVSAVLEITGLVGEDGILPVGEQLDRLEKHLGWIAWIRFPTLFWIDHSDTSLLLVSYAGCLFSVALLVGWRPLLSTLSLFILFSTFSGTPCSWKRVFCRYFLPPVPAGC
jgi:hypothetical protein